MALATLIESDPPINTNGTLMIWRSCFDDEEGATIGEMLNGNRYRDNLTGGNAHAFMDAMDSDEDFEGSPAPETHHLSLEIPADLSEGDIMSDTTGSEDDSTSSCSTISIPDSMDSDSATTASMATTSGSDLDETSDTDDNLLTFDDLTNTVDDILGLVTPANSYTREAFLTLALDLVSHADAEFDNAQMDDLEIQQDSGVCVSALRDGVWLRYQGTRRSKGDIQRGTLLAQTSRTNCNPASLVLLISSVLIKCHLFVTRAPLTTRPIHLLLSLQESLPLSLQHVPPNPHIPLLKPKKPLPLLPVQPLQRPFNPLQNLPIHIPARLPLPRPRTPIPLRPPRKLQPHLPDLQPRPQGLNLHPHLPSLVDLLERLQTSRRVPRLETEPGSPRGFGSELIVRSPLV
ncbi:hypothetical protein KC343_g30 [Hortaea werneckii]|nr:hypothetical protein KC317_g31 [Hortaea werneckii]KAI7628667.1 hypothetical protein KC346_g33 [Hortaea werneckii]KAI7638485.1 hypothetical protein KC343_g30 [Hortaea werneckii]